MERIQQHCQETETGLCSQCRQTVWRKRECPVWRGYQKLRRQQVAAVKKEFKKFISTVIHGTK